MENASKALIIAGAILLSILIIALGVFVFNQAKGAMGNTGLDDQKAAANNQKFEAYEGGAVKGSQVKALIDTVRTNNNSKTNDNDYQEVSVNSKTAAADLTSIKNSIQASSSYVVTISAYSNSGATKGYVSAITITGDFNNR